jgi:uncharacterized protein
LLGTRDEQVVTAGAVLERLWRRRATREPMAIVIDEAHNVCPAEPADPITALAAEDAIRIAGRGTQVWPLPDPCDPAPAEGARERALPMRQPRPDADELTADLAHIASSFSFVPPGLIERATTFHQGETLVAGKIASHPALIRFGAQLTHEGGADVAGW